MQTHLEFIILIVFETSSTINKLDKYLERWLYAR